jgi:hypothetical protein
MGCGQNQDSIGVRGLPVLFSLSMIAGGEGKHANSISFGMSGLWDFGVDKVLGLS